MAKFYGEIGYCILEETAPGVWSETIIPKKYYGDMTRNSRRLITTEQVNSNITISNELSIIADPFATMNFHSIRYVEYLGAKWTVTNAEPQYPRILLTLGGVYNAL